MLLIVSLPPELPAAEVECEAVVVRPVRDGQRVKQDCCDRDAQH